MRTPQEIFRAYVIMCSAYERKVDNDETRTVTASHMISKVCDVLEWVMADEVGNNTFGIMLKKIAKHQAERN